MFWFFFSILQLIQSDFGQRQIDYFKILAVRKWRKRHSIRSADERMTLTARNEFTKTVFSAVQIQSRTKDESKKERLAWFYIGTKYKYTLFSLRIYVCIILLLYPRTSFHSSIGYTMWRCVYTFSMCTACIYREPYTSKTKLCTVCHIHVLHTRTPAVCGPHTHALYVVYYIYHRTLLRYRHYYWLKTQMCTMRIMLEMSSLRIQLAMSCFLCWVFFLSISYSTTL